MRRKKPLIILFVAVLLFATVLMISRPRNQGLYEVTVLPSLGGRFTLPLAINDHGQIAGFSEVSKGNYHLFIWDKENGIRDLGPVINRDVFINDKGQIAADVRDPNGNERALLWDPNAGRTTLPTFGAKSGFAYGINDAGQVIGSAETSSGVEHAFIWDAAKGLLDLTPNSTTRTVAFSVNDERQIVVLGGGATLLVKINEDNTSSSVPVPLRGLCMINNNGYVIGQQNQFDISIWHADFGLESLFLSRNGSPSANINDLNQVIISEGQQPAGLLDKAAPPRNINYLVDPNLGTISLDGYVSVKKNENLCLTNINNEGWIIGAVQSTKDAESKGVLFEPVPEKMEKLIKKSGK